MEQTSSQLVRNIADFNNHQSWFEFEHIYRPMIRNILLNRGLKASELEDGVQEVFLSLMSTIDRFQYDRTKGKFRSWLSKITQRTAIAHHRRKQLANIDPQHISESTDANQGLPELEDERMQLCIALARRRFDEKTWSAFYLRVIEESPIEEVERITQLKANAIYQAVHRVKACLRQMLNQLTAERPAV